MIDTHQHFWKLDRGDYDWLTADLAPLYHDHLPDDLAPTLARNGITGTIAVQAAPTEAETEYLLSLADAHDWIKGVVGWVDLEAPHAVDSIRRLAAHPKLVGLRPMIQGLPDDEWMLRDALRPAIAEMEAQTLTFDALVLPRHLGHLKTFLNRYPDLNVVLDHCAKPQIRDGAFQPWADQIATLAKHPKLWCKLSGLVTEAAQDWSAADLDPYIDHVLACFGPRRILFGSDWPVIKLASDYDRWVGMFNAATERVEDRQAVFTDNATQAYPRLTG